MKLFYHCFGGAHTSITCAAIHLGFLPKDRVPEAYEFLAVPQYDKMANKNLGTPIYVGRDEYGVDIYAIGFKNAPTLMIPVMKSYLNCNNIPSNDIQFVEALVNLHAITAVGGIISRRLNLINIGRPLTVWGIRRSYPVLIDLVSGVKERSKILHR
ncbi:MAG TPA: DUF3189 family protein [Clostridia bacterium]|nr:DUF3189 family protein [Clostridia bacterium]